MGQRTKKELMTDKIIEARNTKLGIPMKIQGSEPLYKYSQDVTLELLAGIAKQLAENGSYPEGMEVEELNLAHI